jgi:putative FmdB family regulatory protein
MPTYGYACKGCGNQFEVIQKITEPALTTCESCGGDLRRLLYPVGVVFKGSGFYVTDYRDKGRSESESKATNGSGEGAAKTDGAAKSDSTKSDSAKSESSTPAKSEPAAAGAAS